MYKMKEKRKQNNYECALITNTIVQAFSYLFTAERLDLFGPSYRKLA